MRSAIVTALLAGFVAWLVVATPAPAPAQVSISALPPASTPLNRTEIVPMVQSSTTVRAHVSDIYDPTAPGNLGTTTPGSALFTTLGVSGAVSGAGVTNLFAAPPALGGVTPNTGRFTFLQVDGSIVGGGLNLLFATPPPIGNTTPNSGAFTSLTASGAVSGVGFTNLFASPPAIGGTAPAAVSATTANATVQDNLGGQLFCSATLPTVTGSGFGTGPAVVASNSCAMDIQVGTSPAAAAGTITLPAAQHGWVCTGADITTQSTTVAHLQQTGAGSQTTATIQNFTDVMGTGTAWTAGDHLRVMCLPE